MTAAVGASVDGSIDAKEFGELRLLMTQLNFSGT